MNKKNVARRTQQTKNAIEMPAHQTQPNMTALKMNAISACPRSILAANIPLADRSGPNKAGQC
jgi:hypothetical protein